MYEKMDKLDVMGGEPGLRQRKAKPDRPINQSPYAHIQPVFDQNVYRILGSEKQEMEINKFELNFTLDKGSRGIHNEITG